MKRKVVTPTIIGLAALSLLGGLLAVGAADQPKEVRASTNPIDTPAIHVQTIKNYMNAGSNSIDLDLTTNVTVTPAADSALVFKLENNNNLATTKLSFAINGTQITGTSASPTQGYTYLGSSYSKTYNFAAYSLTYLPGSRSNDDTFDYVVVPTSNFSVFSAGTGISITEISLMHRMKGAGAVRNCNADYYLYGVYMIDGFVPQQDLDLTGATELYQPSAGTMALTPHSASTAYDVNDYMIASYELTTTRDYAIADSSRLLYDGQSIVLGSKAGSSVAQPYWHSVDRSTTHYADAATDGSCLLNRGAYFGADFVRSPIIDTFTLGRKLVGENVYYTFSDGSFYLCSLAGSNNLRGKENLDETCYFTIEKVDDSWVIKSVNNADRPYMSFNVNVIRCYAEGTGLLLEPYVDDADALPATVASKFSANYMHMSDILPSDASNTGACMGEDGYYAKAKAVYGAMSAEERQAFAANHADAYARLGAWAEANGEILSGNELIASPKGAAYLLKEHGRWMLPIAGVLLAGILAATFIAIKKKKAK